MSVESPEIDIRQLGLRYSGADRPTLAGLSMVVPSSSWTVILGRSGSGKTTLFRYLAGLLDDRMEVSGAVETLNGAALPGRIAYMAQQDLLLPWLNVLDNVCLSTRFVRKNRNVGQAKQRALELLDQVGLTDYAQAMPSQLSGGMRQRVALARTLLQDKPVVFMDEPFSALDAVTRHKLQALAVELLKDRTVILITHDPQEAVRLADQLYVLKGSPSCAQPLSVPDTTPPRAMDAQGAALQQRIFDLLEQDDG